jgi:carboxyl-terminal processing protease
MVRFTAILTAVVLSLGLVSGAYQLGVQDGEGPDGAASLPADFDTLGQVYDKLQSDAVEKPPTEKLLEGAIDGMLGVLGDQYADYFNADQFDDLNNQLDGTFVGIGVVLADTETGLTVQSVIPGSPAESAGLESGERIVTVDGVDVRTTPTGDVAQQVRGEVGTTVRLGLEGGSKGAREVSVTRAQLDLPNVESRPLAGDVGYVSLQQFTDQSGAEVRSAVDELLAAGSRGLVLDLRGNPGGLLRAAIDVTSIFADSGEVVRVGRDVETGQVYRTGGDAVADVPLVVLVNKGSASASEIVAGAIQDLDRGEIVGETTFGKGTVQTISTLDNGGGVKFTTARYFTPSGDSIDGVGVQPDRVVVAGTGTEDIQLAAAEEILAPLIAASSY